MGVRMLTVSAYKRVNRFRAGALDVWKLAGYLTVFLLALMSLFPLYWMITTSIKPSTFIIQLPPEWIPTRFSANSFDRLFNYPNVFRWSGNSFLVAGAVAASNVFWSSLAGYTLAKKQFPGAKVIFWMIISLIMVPWQLMMVPLYILVRTFGWIDTYAALIVPELIYPFTIFLMKQYLATLPSELLDAAKIDGASEFGVYWRVVLPLSLPGLAVVGIFTFMGNWNNFFWPLLVTSSEEMRTIQVGLSKLQNYFYTDYGLLMAGASFAAVPMIVVFLAFQRFFLRGITVGALKG